MSKTTSLPTREYAPPGLALTPRRASDRPAPYNSAPIRGADLLVYSVPCISSVVTLRTKNSESHHRLLIFVRFSPFKMNESIAEYTSRDSTYGRTFRMQQITENCGYCLQRPRLPFLFYPLFGGMRRGSVRITN